MLQILGTGCTHLKFKLGLVCKGFCQDAEADDIDRRRDSVGMAGRPVDGALGGRLPVPIWRFA